MSIVVSAREMRVHSEGSPTSVVLPNGTVSVTQLQDIKEEEDIELTRLNSNESVSSKQRETPLSSLSSVTRQNMDNTNLYDSDKEMFDEHGPATVLSSEKLESVEKTGSVDELSLLPPLPVTIESVTSGQPSLGVREESNSGREEMATNAVGEELEMGVERAVHAQGHSQVQMANIIDATSIQARSLQLDNHDDFINSINNSSSGPRQTLDAPFDLSKALEIPASFNTTNVTNSSGHVHSQENGCNSHSGIIRNTSSTNISSSNSECSYSPSVIASPKVPKRKFSNVLLNSDAIAFPQDQSTTDIVQLQESKVHELRTKSNSNAASFQHLLPNFGMGLDTASIESNANHSSTKMSYDKKTTRKFSNDNSSNSSFSNTSISDELLYKLPPKLTRISNSRSRSNSNTNLVTSTLSLEGLNHASSTSTSAIGTPTGGKNVFVGETNTNMKKVPLLRRASTALLRKTSLKANVHPFEKEFQRSRSASTTPVLPNSSFFDGDSIRRTPPLNKQNVPSTFIEDNENTRGFPGFSTELEEEDLHYVTQLNDSDKPPCRNPSIRSRMRRGISRIISTSGSVKRAVSSASLKSDMLSQSCQQNVDTEQEQSKDNRSVSLSPLGIFSDGNPEALVGGEHKLASSVAGERTINITPESASSLKRTSSSRVRSKDIANVTPVSTSTLMSPVVSNLMQVSESLDGKGGNLTGNEHSQVDSKEGKSTTELNNTGGSSSHELGKKSSTKKLQLGDDKSDYDVTVDLDKLTKSIPTITVTGKINSRSSIPIQQQSNISLDEVYMGRNRKTYEQSSSGNEKDDFDDVNKPEMMTLKEYVGILIRQQQVEDERLAILEKSFLDSGWCSHDDLRAIQQKRTIISKKWAERISYYQSKLDF